MWDLSSRTRDQTRAPCSGSRVLTTGPPGKGYKFSLLFLTWYHFVRIDAQRLFELALVKPILHQLHILVSSRPVLLHTHEEGLPPATEVIMVLFARKAKNNVKTKLNPNVPYM